METFPGDCVHNESCGRPLPSLVVERRITIFSGLFQRLAAPLGHRLHVAQDMRVAEITLSDGSKVYDVLTSPAA